MKGKCSLSLHHYVRWNRMFHKFRLFFAFVRIKCDQDLEILCQNISNNLTVYGCSFLVFSLLSQGLDTRVHTCQ